MAQDHEKSGIVFGTPIFLPQSPGEALYSVVINKEYRKEAEFRIGDRKTRRAGGLWYTFAVCTQEDKESLPTIHFGIQVPDLEQAILIKDAFLQGFADARVPIVRGVMRLLIRNVIGGVT